MFSEIDRPTQTLSLIKQQLAETYFNYATTLVGSTRYLIREWKANPYFDTTAYVNHRKVTLVLVWYRDDSLEYMRQLMDMTCVDHMDRGHRFTLWYTGLSITHQKRANILTSVAERAGTFSAVNVYPSLNWSEREAWDMFGVTFAGHPDMRRILSDYGFKGFPLRKNFPAVGYWEKWWDKSDEAIVQKLVSLMQEPKTVNPYFDYFVKYLDRIVDDVMMEEFREMDRQRWEKKGVLAQLV